MSTVSSHEADDRFVGLEDAVGREDEEETEGERDRQAAGETKADRWTHPPLRHYPPWAWRD